MKLYQAGRLILTVMIVTILASISAVSSSPNVALAKNIQPAFVVKNTDYVAAGYGGMRGSGSGTIKLSGVSGKVTKALLYWSGPTKTTSTSVNAKVKFAKKDITGKNIGLSSDDNWGFKNSQAYRADVTSLVKGNGSYSLSNFRNRNADINGVSLLVFFNDSDNKNNRDIIIFDGNDANAPNSYDANGWNVTLPGINYTSGTVRLQLHVSDGQGFDDDALILNTKTLSKEGPVFDGNSVPNGPSKNKTRGGLWDIKSYDITSVLASGNNTLYLTTGVTDDYVSLIVAVVSLPAGNATSTTDDDSQPASEPEDTTNQNNPASNDSGAPVGGHVTP